MPEEYRITGYVCTEPEFFTTTKGKQGCSWKMPTRYLTKDGKENTRWRHIEVYGRQAEIFKEKGLEKHTVVEVVGVESFSLWTDRKNETHLKITVHANKVNWWPPKASSQQIENEKSNQIHDNQEKQKDDGKDYMIFED